MRTANPAAMSSAMTAGRANREEAIVSPSSTGVRRGHPLAATSPRQGVELGDLSIGVIGACILALTLQLEPNFGAPGTFDAPLVGELVDQEQAPSGPGLGGRLADRRLGRLEARALV